MRIKVNGGTSPSGADPLCPSCASYNIARGTNSNQVYATCSAFIMIIKFPVTSCTRYNHANSVSLYDMQNMAWSLCADKRGHSIGFKPPDEVDRLVADEKIVDPALKDPS